MCASRTCTWHAKASEMELRYYGEADVGVEKQDARPRVSSRSRALARAHLGLLLGSARLDERLALADVPHELVRQHVVDSLGDDQIVDLMAIVDEGPEDIARNVSAPLSLTA